MECKFYITLHIIRIICSLSSGWSSKLSSNFQRNDEFWTVEQWNLRVSIFAGP